MDPNAALTNMRAIIEVEKGTDGEWSLEVANDRLTALVEHIDALDEWLSSGGFLPDAWTVVLTQALNRQANR